MGENIMSIIKVKNDYDDSEPFQENYYEKYRKAIELLRKSHKINNAILSFVTIKDLEVLQKITGEIEDII